MAIIDELITLLGFESDSSVKTESDKYNSSLKSMTDGAAKLAAGVLIAQVAVTGFVKSFAASTDESGKFAAQLGISYESLQELEYAAKIAGGSVDELRGDLAGLAEQFGHLDSADNILLDMAEKMEGLSRVEQLQLGKQLGLSSGTLRLIAEGRDGIAALRQEARALGGVLSEETTKDAAAFQDQLVRLDTVTGALFGTIAAGLLPVLTESSKLMTDFVVANQELIKSSVGQVVGGMTMGLGFFSDAVMLVLSLLPDLEGGLDATRVIALAVATAMGILATKVIIASLPFIVMGAAIAGVIIILEDLWTAIQGGDSVIGDLVNAFSTRFPKISEVIGRVVETGKDFFSTFWKVIKKYVGLIGDIFGTSFGVWVDIFSKGFQSIEDLFDGMSFSDAATKLIDGIGDSFSLGFELIKEDFIKFFKEITDLFVDLDLSGKVSGFFTFDDDDPEAQEVDTNETKPKPKPKPQINEEGIQTAVIGVIDAVIGSTDEKKVISDPKTEIDPIKPQQIGLTDIVAGAIKLVADTTPDNADGKMSFVGQANSPVKSKIPASIVNSTSNAKADNRQFNVVINGANSPENVTNQLMQKTGFSDVFSGAMPLGGG